MKYEFLNNKKNILEIIADTPSDLWTIYKLIDPGDIISGYDFRVLKHDNSKNKEKVKIWVKLEVENIKFHEYSDSIRVSGKILEASEFIGGKYHTFVIKPGKKFILEKKNITNFHLKELENVNKNKEKILIVSLDDSSICLAEILDRKINVILEKRWRYSKLDPYREEKLQKEFIELSKKIIDISPQYNLIIFVSPGFWGEKLRKYIEDLNKEILKKIKTFKTSLGGYGGIKEFLKRKEFLNTLKNIELLKVNSKINDFLLALLKGYAVLGYEKIKEIYITGIIDYLLIDQTFFNKLKEEGKIKELLEIIKTVEDLNGKIYFVYPDNENYDIIQKNGIVAKLRYKLE